MRIHNQLDVSKIFYINLEESKDRRTFVESNLSKLGIPYVRFPAIRPTIDSLLKKNGRYNCFYERSNIKEYFKNENVNKIKYAIGTLGCYISHYLVHKLAKNMKIKNYILIEDDCELTEENLCRLDNIIKKNNLTDYDIIRSCWESTSELVEFKNSNHQSNHKIGDGHDYCGGTHFQYLRDPNRIIQFMDSDGVYNVDSVYSTHKLKSYYTNICKYNSDFKTNIGRHWDWK